MKLLLDTTVLIDVLRGSEGATAFLDDALRTRHHLVSVTPVRTEVLAGMRSRERVITAQLFSLIEWIDITIDLADDAGALARTYLRSHPGVDVVDYLVAAVARRDDAELCTSNIKHFPMFKGLRPPY